jgi:hypothetical protein
MATPSRTPEQYQPVLTFVSANPTNDLTAPNANAAFLSAPDAVHEVFSAPTRRRNRWIRANAHDRGRGPPLAPASTTMTIFDVLTRQHRETEELFGDLQNAIATGQLELAEVMFQLLANRLISGMIADHADLEEYTLFPIARLEMGDEILGDLADDYLAFQPRAAAVAGASITYLPARCDVRARAQ